MLLSASVPTAPGYSLTNGNLYNTAISSSQPIDTGVQNFAVASNEVVDLHTNGTLESMNSDGSGKLPLGSGAQTFSSFQVDGTGSVVALNSAGNLYRYSPGSNVPATIGSFGTSSTLLMDPSGSAMILDSSDGNLYRMAPGSNTLSHIGSFGLSSTFLVDGSGSAMILDSSDGNLYRMAPGSNTLSHIGSFGKSSTFLVDGAGSAMILDSVDGNLYRMAPGSNTLSHIGSFGLSSTFRIDGAGSAMILDSSDGTLYRMAPGANTLSEIGSFGKSSTFRVDGSGSAMILDSSDGDLYRMAPGSNTLNQITSNVQSFAIGGDGALFVLANSGLLQQMGTDGQLHQVSFDLSLFTSLTSSSDGKVYALDSGNTLYMYTPQAGWTSVASNVQAFALGADGVSFYTVDTNDNFVLHSSAAPQTLAPNTVYKTLNGSITVLESQRSSKSSGTKAPTVTGVAQITIPLSGGSPTFSFKGTVTEGQDSQSVTFTSDQLNFATKVGLSPNTSVNFDVQCNTNNDTCTLNLSGTSSGQQLGSTSTTIPSVGGTPNTGGDPISTSPPTPPPPPPPPTPPTQSGGHVPPLRDQLGLFFVAAPTLEVAFIPGLALSRCDKDEGTKPTNPWQVRVNPSLPAQRAGKREFSPRTLTLAECVFDWKNGVGSSF